MKKSPAKLPLKRKFIAVLIAAILPGFGHMYLGLAQRGIQFIAVLLLDIAALFYFTSKGIQINVPLLILLALMIPVIYFYNVYDVLQSTDWINYHIRALIPKYKRRKSFAGVRGISFGLVLMAEGLLICMFLVRPFWLRNIVSFWGGYVIAVICIVIGVGLLAFQIVRIYRTIQKQKSSATSQAVGGANNDR
ncbi:hypothetical protein ACFSGI_02390 [Paenibacillus nicotianae]|uniref:Uncharacterized protein n=1 Tax=Paenibacillus nicotianae TaxID=1526551 RepID=A0ABW4UP17_9BACL